VLSTVIPSDTLAGNKDLSIGYQPEAVKPALSYPVTGYTLFGAIYVLAAVAKMNEKANTLQKQYDALLAAHPEIPSLRDTFVQELELDLRADGLKLNPIHTLNRQGDGDDLHYVLSANEISSKKVLIFDHIATGYFAAGSTDPYHADAAVLVSVLDQADLSAKPQRYAPSISCQQDKLDAAHIYPGFDEISKDPQGAYGGLQQCLRRLAAQIADRFASDSNGSASLSPAQPAISSAAPTPAAAN